MKIEQAVLDNVLGVYKPECRYLVETDLNFPEARGLFRIPKSFYIEDTGHFNAVELIICYNQLAYAMFAEAGRRGLVPELGEFSLEDFEKNQLRNMLIVSMDNVKFRKPIDSMEFRGKIRLNQTIKKRNGLYFFKTEYDFGDGKATGEIDLALALGVI